MIRAKYTRTVRVALAVATGLALVNAAGDRLDREAHALDNQRPPITCQEDMPCWDCSTMGNHVCGPTTTTIIDIGTPATLWRALPETR